ncbi:MAG: PglZ domain-containing protein [Cetobacterium sp.]
MNIKLIYGYSENQYVYSNPLEYPKLYLNIKNSIKNNEKIEYYTNDLNIFRWCGFFNEAYPGFIEFIKTDISNNKIKYKPNNPTVPKCESLKEWEEWIINEYFPYKEYLDKENITISKELNEYILKFSDFYYSNYSYLKNSDKFISNILHDIGEEIREDEVSIILVIDNFNFSLKNILCRFLNEKKIKIAAEKFYFTTIPSETKFGKQALLRLSSLNFKSNWIVSNLTEIKTKFREKNIEYKNKISEINELEMLENMIYVVNYLEIDELLHTDNLKVAGEISDKVEHELEKISILLESILKKEKKLGIYIVTDHGSIKTYDKVLKIDNQIINTLTKNSGDIITEISKQDIAKNKFILESFGYILDKEIFLLDKNYYIAKQGIYFKNITGEKYLHGGISPDEICIPFIKIKNY